MKDDALIQKAEEAAEFDLLTLNEKRDRVADRLVKYALDKGIQVFLDQEGQPHVIFSEKPTVAFPIKSPALKRWLAGKYWAEFEKGFSGENFLQVVASLEGKAFHENNVRAVFNRVAIYGNVIFYDLGDGKRAVKVTPDGWQITSDCPILFYRFKHQKPQVEPVSGGDLNNVLKFINIKSENDKLLFLTYLVVALIPDVPRAVLINTGDQGAAKSTALRVARSLIDPSISELLEPARSVEELILNANHHYCLYLDNLSFLPEWLSDTLCRLCTGIGFSKRKLFYDDDDIIFQQKVAIGLTGINLVAEKADLLDRCLILRFEQIQDDERVDEKEFWLRFDDEKPKILGALFDTLSDTLKIVSSLSLPHKPRMADYAKYAAAAAISLGKTAERFLLAFGENISRQNQAAVESSPTAQVLLQFMEDKPEWSGRSSELYQELKPLAEEANLDIGKNGFPKGSNWLWKKIAAVKTNLFALGIKVAYDQDKTGSKITIKKISKSQENTAITTTTAKTLMDSDGNRNDESSDAATVGQPQLNSTDKTNKEIVAPVAANSAGLEEIF